MTAFEFIGIVAAVLYCLVFCMKTMISLRVVGMASGAAWLIYGSLGGLVPIILMELVLLPMNFLRFMQIRRLTEHARLNFTSEISIEALLPFMTRKRLKKGDVLFRKGDISHDMYYLVSGVIRLDEIGEYVTSGEILGEIGMFTPTKERTVTAIMETDVELMKMSDDTVFQLYSQDPAFGSYLTRLITGRLIENYTKLEEQVIGKMTTETKSIELTPHTIRQDDLLERQIHGSGTTPEDPPRRRFSRSRLLVLASVLGLLVLAMGGWHLAPYFRSVFFRDAIVTTWINAAASPIRGQIVGPVPMPGEQISGAGRTLEIRDAQADNRPVANSEAKIERLLNEVATLDGYIMELQDTYATLARRADNHTKIFEENLKIKKSGLLKELAAVKAQLGLVRAEADRKSQLVKTAIGSISDADKAQIAVRILERQESELEKEIADVEQRKRAIEQGVYITNDGHGPDWAYDNRDALLLEIARTKKTIGAHKARLAEAQKLALAERDDFQRKSSSFISLPPGSIVWSALIDDGATVIPGQSAIEWIDCGTVFLDVPVSDSLIAEIKIGVPAVVILEGEDQVRQGTVVQKRGAASILGLSDLAAVSSKRISGEGQVLLDIDLSDVSGCPVGRSASVEFPDVNFLHIIRSRLRI